MKSLALAILAVMAVATFLSPQARADAWDKKTIVTFSEPVEVPGQVLPAGTYVFKLADMMADRNVVQVFNKDENHIYGTFLAIPDYRMKAPDRAIITFEERAAGSPQAIKAWFYPGDNYGDEFVYPKGRAPEVALVTQPAAPAAPTEQTETTNEPVNNEPVQSAEQPAVAQTEQPPVTAEQPESGEQQLAQADQPPSLDNSASRQAESTPSELPKTGSEMPLIGLIGLISLGAGCSLRMFARRIGWY